MTDNISSNLVAKAVRPNELHEYVRHECDHGNRVTAPCVRVYEAAAVEAELARLHSIIRGKTFVTQDETSREPLLGLATTEQLLKELMARAEVGGYADYRTVDSEHHSTMRAVKAAAPPVQTQQPCACGAPHPDLCHCRIFTSSLLG